jgi:MFS family permease
MDRSLLFGAAFFRSSAVSLCGVILGTHLASLGFGAPFIGLAVTLGLSGCAAGTFFVTVGADRWGRRRVLIALALLMAAGGLGLSGATGAAAVALWSLLGMVNGMGRDRGAALTVDQAILPQIAGMEGRTRAFAWYNVTVDAGHAAGALLAFLPAAFRSHGLPPAGTWLFYSFLCLVAAGLSGGLSKKIEPKERIQTVRLTPASKPRVIRFTLLSALDSLGGGFLTTALVSYWFFRRFGVDEYFLAPLFFSVRVLNALSHLGAAYLAKRIGLVNTMVFTHLPSSFLLMTVPLAPNLEVAAAMFLLRELLVEMDVPTRQSYLVAIVREEERMLAAGISNLARSSAWALAPAMAGASMAGMALSAPLVIGPGLKILYDLLLYRGFRNVKPPEEERPPEKA